MRWSDGETVPEPPPELVDALMALSLVLVGEGPGLKRVLDTILGVAQRSVTGCDAGSVSLVVEGRPHTEAMIDLVVVAVDLAQYQMNEGLLFGTTRPNAVAER